MKRLFLILFVAGTLATTMNSCRENESDAEEAVEETGEAIEEGAEETGDAAEDAVN